MKYIAHYFVRTLVFFSILFKYMSKLQQTHFYDGKFKDKYKKMILIDNRELLKSETFESSIRFITKISQNNSLKRNINRTINLFLNDKKNNYDPTSGIKIEDLLPLITRFIKHYDISGQEIFLEQISDIIKMGSCCQGRINRLVQFYIHHVETRDEIFMKCVEEKIIKIINEYVN